MVVVVVVGGGGVHNCMLTISGSDKPVWLSCTFKLSVNAV